MQVIPQDTSFDGTLGLLFDGYEFISKRCERLDTDVFQTRLLFQKTICLRGEDAARLFYDEERFERRDAAPSRLKKTLLGDGGVQGLDDDTHRHRKRMFMSLMTPENIRHLADLTVGQWRQYAEKWERREKIVLFDEVQEILCRAVCRWSGVPLAESEVGRRTGELAAMIEGSGAVGWRHWRGRWARKRAEKWLGNLVGQVRAGNLKPDEQSALHLISFHREPDGKPLDERIAAVELLNVLRPTVAIARFVIFSALALREHPESAARLRSDADDYREFFVQETRRFYPFFPFAAARVRKSFEWREYVFPEKTRVLLDLYGTNRDRRLWREPNEFQPERFRGWNKNSFDFIPQGGGDYFAGHRCAGEFVTIELMKASLGFLAGSLEYEVPPQNLSISLTRIPAIPKSRFVIKNVRRI